MIVIEFVSKINISERLRRPPLLKRRGLNLKIDFRDKIKKTLDKQKKICYNIKKAGMSELADETDSKSVVSNGVWVQVPLPAPKVKSLFIE